MEAAGLGGLTVRLPASVFACPICFSDCATPKTSTCCGYLACEACVDKLVDDACPIHRRRTYWVTPAWVLLLRAQACFDCALGCGEVLTVADAADHDCPALVRVCYKCKEILRGRACITHLCPLALVPCVCGDKVRRSRMADHKAKRCPAR